MYPLELLLHLVGAILAGTAAFLAVRLIPHTGKLKGWLFISAALASLAVECITRLLTHSDVLAGKLVHLTLVDALPVATSVLFLAGIISSRANFRERKATLEILEEQISRLQHASTKADAEMPADEPAARQSVGDSGKEGSEDLPMLKNRELEQHRIAQADREWQAVFDAVTAPLFLYDRAYRVIRANRAYTDQANMALKDIIGKPYFEVFPKLGHPIIDPPQNFEQGTARSELRLETGEVFLSRNFPVYNEANEYHHSLHILEDVTQVKQAERSVRRTRQALKVVTACIHEMLLANDEPKMLQTLCRVAVESGGYRLAWVGNAEHDENKTVRPVASHGQKKDVPPLPNPTWADTESGHGPIGIAIRTGKTCIAQDFIHDPQFGFFHSYAAKNNLASVVGLPLYEGKSVWGGLVLCSDESFAFSKEEVAVLEVLSASVAFGVTAFRIRAEHMASLQESTRRIDGLRNNLEDIIVAMGTAIEKRHPYAIGHHRRVGEICMALALEMGLPDEQAYGVRLAGMVHDVGDIQVPEEIFCKTGELTEDERMQIERHPQVGHDILSGLNLPWPIVQAVLQHHERLDGSGYPKGLKGDELLLEAKIIAVADTIQAVAYAQRPDHPRLGLSAALAEVERNKGTLYDEVVVDAALRLFREKGYEVS